MRALSIAARLLDEWPHDDAEVIRFNTGGIACYSAQGLFMFLIPFKGIIPDRPWSIQGTATKERWLRKRQRIASYRA